MNNIKLLPKEIWGEYGRGQMYNDSIGLYERVGKAENFFLGRQWIGVNAPDMDKPVFNLLKRVINYFVAMLVSDNIGVSLSLFNRKSDSTTRISLEILEENIRQIMEYNDYGRLMRKVLRDAAVDGDGCIHVYFDPAVETGRELERGFVRAERINNTDIYFGDPYNSETEEQPYIIISQRKQVSDVRSELEKFGRKKEAMELEPDLPEYRYGQDQTEANDGKVTVLIKYYKKNGSVFYTKTTRDITITEACDTGLKMYPVCFMNWDAVKDSYHGVSVIEGLIPN